MRGTRRLRLTLVLLLLTAFTFAAIDSSNAQSGPLGALRRGIDTVFGPMERVVGGAAGSVGRALGGLPRLGSYQEENRKLARQIDDLKGRLAATAGAQCELDQLRQLARFVDVTSYTTVPARIVAVGPASGFEWTAVIDAGSADGIKVAMTVVTGAGLVGRTTQVSSHTAKVLLLRDRQFTVGGSIADVASVGFTRGTGQPLMDYRIASTRVKVVKGDVLLTTGSDTYAAGVPIGTVIRVVPDANALSRIASIAPFVDVSALDIVGVITNGQRTRPRGVLRPTLPNASASPSPCAAAVPQGPVPTATPQPSVTANPTTMPTATPTSTPSASRAGGRGPQATPSSSWRQVSPRPSNSPSR